MQYPNKNKFGAMRTVCALNHPHPSKLEASVCQILQLREKAGEIIELKWQATVHLAFGIKWKVDWSFRERMMTISGASLEFYQKYAEAKGKDTRDFRLKLRMWKEGCGPAPLELWRGTYKRPMLEKTIYPKEKNEND